MSVQIAPNNIILTKNYKRTDLRELSKDPYTFDGEYAKWDGSGDTEVLLEFPMPEALTPIALSGEQLFVVKLRKAGAPGGRLQSYHLELWQAGDGIRVVAAEYNVDLPEEGKIVTASWDPALLLDPSAAKVQIKVRQVYDGAYGKPSERRSVELGAAAWIQSLA